MKLVPLHLYIQSEISHLNSTIEVLKTQVALSSSGANVDISQVQTLINNAVSLKKTFTPGGGEGGTPQLSRVFGDGVRTHFKWS